METFIVQIPFPGYAQTYLKNGKTYDGKTAQEYIAEHSDKVLKEVSTTELIKLTEECYRTALQPITKDEWYEHLEELPPLKWRNLGRYETFFSPEATSADFHAFYVRDGKKYYSATKSIFSSETDLLEDILKETKE